MHSTIKKVHVFCPENLTTLFLPSKKEEEGYCGSYRVYFPDWIAAILCGTLAQGKPLDKIVTDKKRINPIFIFPHDDLSMEALTMLKRTLFVYLKKNKNVFVFIFCPKVILNLLSFKLNEPQEGMIPHVKEETIRGNENRNIFSLHVLLTKEKVYTMYCEPLYTALQAV